METSGGGTTMSAGAAVSVARGASPEASGKAHLTGVKRGAERQNTAGHESVSAPNMGGTPDARHEQEQAQKDIKVAERLFETAKEDGVDEALERLADRDEKIFEKDTSGNDTKPEVLDDKLSDPGEIQKKRSFTPMEMEAHSLKAQTEKISEMTDMGRRLESAEETLYNLSVFLRRLGEEEDEEKKKHLLVIFAEIMAKLMQAMFVPQEGDGIVDGGQSKEDKALERIAA